MSTEGAGGTGDTEGTGGTEGRNLPEGITDRLKGLISELKEQERQDTESLRMGELELRIDENQANWEVAYKTVSQ